MARARGTGDPALAYAAAAHLRRRTAQAALLVAVVAMPFWLMIRRGHLGDGLCVATLLLD